MTTPGLNTDSGGETTPTEVTQLRRAIDERDRRIAELTARVLAIEGTVTWRLSERVRAVAGRLPLARRAGRLGYLARRTVEVLLDEGPRDVLPKALDKLRRGGSRPQPVAPGRSLDEQYEEWLRRQETDASARRRQIEKRQGTHAGPLVSVVTFAAGDTLEPLRTTIDSARRQTYPRGEVLVVLSGDGAEPTSGQGDPGPDRGLGVPAAAEDETPDTVRYVRSPNRLAGLCAARGDWIALVAEGDRLAETALCEVVAWLEAGGKADLVYTDEDEIDESGRRRQPFFKPGFSPDLLLSVDYAVRCCVFRRDLLDALTSTGLQGDVEGEYDLVLRLSEVAGRVAHIPKVLYHRRAGRTSSGRDAQARAVAMALRRRGRPARVESFQLPGSAAPARHVRYAVPGRPLVSIIIPTRDRGELLRQCLASIADRTDYERREVLVIDNGTRDPATLRLLVEPPPGVRVLRYPGPFNFSAINNFAVGQARGDHLLFLNNDVQVISREWLTAMVEHGARREVGAVGARLVYPGGTIQHAGLILGVPGTVGHAFRHQPEDTESGAGLPHVIRNCTAVTGACLLLRREVFEEAGGFDEQFRVDFNDVDLCLRIRALGYLVVYTPLARLYHYEGATRRRLRLSADERRFRSRWRQALEAGDPYYNVNLTRDAEDWSLRL